MIKQIIQIADVHLRCVQRMEEYTEQLTKLIDKIQEITRPFKKEEVRIVISCNYYYFPKFLQLTNK